VSILRLPLSSVVIALLLTSKAGIGVAPLITVAVTVAYITIEVLSERRVPEAQSTLPLDSQVAATAAGR
jgi:hypothetical protein